jgi:catechol 2,3-dioxygenase-like lactoylglutathione lyase family enzyme
MPGPARAGAVLYAKDVERLAAFYETLLPMARVHADAEIIVSESPDFQLVIHAIPPHIASTIVIGSPPVRRAETALKLFFTVSSLSEARSTAARLGGEVFSEEWQGPGFRVCNACDPEGNIFQVRESTP